MPNKLIGLLVAAGLLTLVPATAGAAVSVRAESGDVAPVVSATVTPTTGLVTGNAGVYSCSGTGTAAGALNAATGGNWGGQEFFGDFQVGRIGAVDFTTAPTAPYYWSFVVNDVPASAGICQTNVADNDRILFYKACNTALTGCYSGTILSIVALPGIPGAPTAFAVDQVDTTFASTPPYAATTTRVPAAGVTVSSGSASAVTGADGRATLTLPAGQQTVRATRGNDVPGEATTCVATANNGLCGTVDKAAPVSVVSIPDGQIYRKRGPRTLTGLAQDSAGVAKVELRLTARPSTRSKKCTMFDATKARFVKQSRCGVVSGKLFEVKLNGDKWSYLLPSAPTKDRYVLDAIVTDSGGNKSINRSVFFVR